MAAPRGRVPDRNRPAGTGRLSGTSPSHVPDTGPTRHESRPCRPGAATTAFTPANGAAGATCAPLLFASPGFPGNRQGRHRRARPRSAPGIRAGPKRLARRLPIPSPLGVYGVKARRTVAARAWRRRSCTAGASSADAV